MIVSFQILSSSSIIYPDIRAVYIVTCKGAYRRGIGLDIGFIGHFSSQFVITLKYSAIANLYNLQSTRAHAKSLPVFSDFARRFLVTASNSGDSSASTLTSLPAESESESYVTADGQSASLSWNKAPIRGLRPDFYYCQTFAGLLMWGALSDKRTGLLFTISAGPRQSSHSRI
jgi:hypothetical protein